MIFLDLVGGGGNAKSSLVITGLACAAGFFLERPAGIEGDAGRYDESEPLADGVDELVLDLSAS